MLLQCCSRAGCDDIGIGLDCFLVEYEEIRVQFVLLGLLIRMVVLVVPVGLVLLSNQVVWNRRE